MKALAELLGDLAETPHSKARMRRLTAYFDESDVPVGWSAAWLTNALKPPRQTPAKLRQMAESRVDPELFRLSAAALGDIAETVALIWPGAGDQPVEAIAAGGQAPPDMLDGLDAEARVAVVRLLTGRKAKGVKARDVHLALAQVFGVDASLIAGAMIEEAPPYPRLCAWLAGDGPAPNWAPPHPPDLPRLGQPPQPPFDAWRAPLGHPVAVESGRAFGAEGEAVNLTTHASDGWGFLQDDRLFDPMTAPPLEDPQAVHDNGLALLIRFHDTGGWAIWPAAARLITCPVTFIDIGRAVNVTLGVAMGDEIAPLAKLPAPEAAKVSAFARKAVVDKFGPVRQVGPGLWAEVAYEAVRAAPRRKIGVALDGARIIRLIWNDGPATPDLSEIV